MTITGTTFGTVPSSGTLEKNDVCRTTATMTSAAISSPIRTVMIIGARSG